MATFISGYISDLSPVKDNIKLRMRILRAWLQLLYNNQQVKNMEMIVIDEHDETGTMLLLLFNDEVQAMVGRSAYQLREKYAKSESDGSIPTEITNLIGNKYTFKVATDDYNVKKLLPVFTVLRLSNDQEIINSALACTTPIKDNEATSNTISVITSLTFRSQDNEATSNTISAITSLDLESQTDENTTPNEKQKTNKRPAEREPRSESSTGKKKAVEIKVEKKCLNVPAMLEVALAYAVYVTFSYTTMDENDPANARKHRKELMSNKKRASSKDKRSNPSVSSDAFLTGLSTSLAHPQPTIRNRMPLSDITNHVRRTPKQSTNLATSPLAFGNIKTPTLENSNG
nr:hypothetical protein [Tanacetum cinerariifolium]